MSKRTHSQSRAKRNRESDEDSSEEEVNEVDISRILRSKSKELPKKAKSPCKIIEANQKTTMLNTDILTQKVLDLQSENKKLHDAQLKAIQKVQDENQKMVQMQYLMLQEVVRLKEKFEDNSIDSPQPEVSVTTKLNDFITIPCKTIENLWTLEEFLITDEAVKNRVVNKIHSLFQDQGPYQFIQICLSAFATRKCLDSTTYSDEGEYTIKHLTIIEIIKDFMADNYAMDQDDIENELMIAFENLQKSFRTKWPKQHHDDFVEEKYNYVKDDEESITELLLTNDINLPCKTLKEFLELNELIKEDSNVRQILKSAMMSKIENSIQITIKSIISLLMDKKCCKQVTFAGKNNTVGLKNLDIYKVLVGTLKCFKKSDEEINKLSCFFLKRLKSKFLMAERRAQTLSRVNKPSRFK